MSRCSLSLLATTVCVAALAAPAIASAQLARNLPAHSLRGEMVFGYAPEVSLNGKPARLAPAARIRGLDNMLVMSGSLTGRKATVNYTLEPGSGLVKEVWLLRPEEAKKLWPQTLEEANTWTFDPLGQIWTKP